MGVEENETSIAAARQPEPNSVLVLECAEEVVCQPKIRIGDVARFVLAELEG